MVSCGMEADHDWLSPSAQDHGLAKTAAVWAGSGSHYRLLCQQRMFRYDCDEARVCCEGEGWSDEQGGKGESAPSQKTRRSVLGQGNGDIGVISSQ